MLTFIIIAMFVGVLLLAQWGRDFLVLVIVAALVTLGVLILDARNAPVEPRFPPVAQS